MTGHPDPQALALWVGGDLDAHTAPEISLHLDACPACRKTVEEIEAAQALLRSAFAEPSEADLQWVRRGISQSLRDRRRTIRLSWSFGSAFAAVVLLLVALTQHKSPKPAVTEDTVQLPPLAVRLNLALEIPEVTRTERVHHRPARADVGLRAVNFVPRGDGLVQLRVTTADPNVIILLSPMEKTVEQ